MTPPEILSLRETGPFTRDPHRVKFILDADEVKQRLNVWFVQSMSFVKQAMRRAGISNPSDLTLAKIARSQVGRPNVDCGSGSYFELTRPILDCDTKSDSDAIEIREHCITHSGNGDPNAEQMAQIFAHLPADAQGNLADSVAAKMGPVAILLRGDGQSVISMARDKLKNFERTKVIIPVNGHFHTRGHLAFALNEGLHDIKYGRTKALLSKDKVPKHIGNFENDSYLHCTTHIRDDYIGTLAYFLLRVEKPPPELLLDDPLGYFERIQSAGGIAAFESMRYGGVPMAHYHMAARAEDGEKACELEAYAFHVCRALAHKPVEARVLLISLISSQTTHPKLSQIVKQTAFFNWLGRKGSSVDADRAMENINRMQDERRSTFAAFERALEFTPALAAFAHVNQALDVADNGESEACDPLRQGTITAARVVCDDLAERLGTDLTIPDDTNQVFHTGGGPDTVNSTATLSHRPSEMIWRVAAGTSTGAGRSGRPESAPTYIDRFIDEHLWTSKS